MLQITQVPYKANYDDVKTELYWGSFVVIVVVNIVVVVVVVVALLVIIVIIFSCGQ